MLQVFVVLVFCAIVWFNKQVAWWAATRWMVTLWVVALIVGQFKPDLFHYNTNPGLVTLWLGGLSTMLALLNGLVARRTGDDGQASS